MTAEAPADTRIRILDAAARLFSTHGAGATSLRAIIREAGVNLNAIHYHFGSKTMVTREVFRRIMTPINRERHKLLDRAESPEPSLEALIHAVYWPLIWRGGQSPRSKTRKGLLIAAQLRHDPSPEARNILAENKAEFAPRFERLLEIATGRREKELHHAIRFINAAAWGVATQPALLDEILRAGDRDKQFQAIFDDFLRFAVAGIQSLPRRKGTRPARTSTL